MKTHASFDLQSRAHKAIKIERLLDLSERRQPIRLLEIGTGSGGIAHYFATHPSMHCEVTAVDTVDGRQIKGDYTFMPVTGTTLPFDEGGFDVVVSNHVIEHVGDEKLQQHHLSEVRRVMAQDGIGYLACPNRWMLVEPHYQLAFLSWLPAPMRSSYLRLMRKGAHYDCHPLTISKLESLLRETGFDFENLATRALRELIAIEGKRGAIVSMANRLPDRLLDRLAWINPTLVYRLNKKEGTGFLQFRAPGQTTRLLDDKLI